MIFVAGFIPATFFGVDKMSFLEVTMFLLDGFKISLIIFAVTLIFGIPLGLPIAFCSMSRIKIIRNVSKVIVWIVRGIPLMLQIFIIYYVPGLLFKYPMFSDIDKYMYMNYSILDAGRIVAVLIAFVINYACYFSEIYRGGIESISKGQYEAGYVLGLTKSQTFKHVILKQVIKRIVPPMGNEIITLVKDTSLARVIGVHEIIMHAEDYSRVGVIWPLFSTALFFLAFVGALSLLLNYIEKKLDYYH